MNEPMEHLGHLEEIAKAAATEYGADWATIPGWSKEIWRNTVKDTPRRGGITFQEQCAGRAIDAWYNAREDTAPLDEPKKKTKGGK